MALAAFAFVTSVTPGPNNVLLLASGARFGLAATLPHILGIQFGVATQLVMSGMGLGYLVLQVPALAFSLKLLGSAYLCYLCWKLSLSRFEVQADDKARPFGFWQAAAFQFINPKAWMMSLTAGALLTPDMGGRAASIFALCAVFALVGGSSSGSWAVLGAAIHRILRSPRAYRAFNFAMVALLLYTAASFWWTP